MLFFFFSSRRRHTRFDCDWSSDVCSSDLVRGGARLIATNPDRTCPTEEGEIPDCAGMIAAVEAGTGVRGEGIVGKPSPLMLEVALERLRPPGPGGAMVGGPVATGMGVGQRLGAAPRPLLRGNTR